MERAKYFLIFFIVICSLQASGTRFRQEVYQAYISNDMVRWSKVIDAMLQLPDRDNASLMELVNYQYGYIAWCIGTGRKKEAAKNLDQAVETLNLLERSGFRLSWVEAYRSAMYGYRIGLNNLKAPFWGPRSLESARKSVKLDPDNYFGYIQLGNAEYYMPAVFGGSKEKALGLYRKAETLFEKSGEGLEENWNYLGLLAMIGQACMETGKFEEARDVFLKALKAEPAFLWVKDELYPRLLKRLENKNG